MNNKVNLLNNRIDILKSRKKDNQAIIKKLEREVRNEKRKN